MTSGLWCRIVVLCMECSIVEWSVVLCDGVVEDKCMCDGVQYNGGNA